MLEERIVRSGERRLVVGLAVAAALLAGSGSARGQTPEATTPAPAPSAAEATPDLTPPQLRGLHLLRRHWSVEDRDTALAARVWPRGGTGVLFTASEPGVLIVRVQREARGDRTCRTHCHRFRTVVTFTRQFDTTPSCFWYSGRAAGRALRPGRHRFLVHAIDATGNRTGTRRLTFTIQRHRSVVTGSVTRAASRWSPSGSSDGRALRASPTASPLASVRYRRHPSRRNS